MPDPALTAMEHLQAARTARMREEIEAKYRAHLNSLAPRAVSASPHLVAPYGVGMSAGVGVIETTAQVEEDKSGYAVQAVEVRGTFGGAERIMRLRDKDLPDATGPQAAALVLLFTGRVKGNMITFLLDHNLVSLFDDVTEEVTKRRQVDLEAIRQSVAVLQQSNVSRTGSPPSPDPYAAFGHVLADSNDVGT